MSTVEDLYKWNNALLAYKLVKKETLEKAFTPFTLNNGTRTSYGYGWFIDSLDGVKRIHHEGQVSGFIAQEEYFPDAETYVALMTNVKTGDDTTDFSDNRFQLMNNIFKLAIGKKLDKEVVVNDSLLDEYVGTYQSVDKKKETQTVYKQHGKLYMNLSNKTGMHMVLQPLSPTLFLLPDVQRIRTTAEFIIENGKVTKVIWTQGKKYEAIKIK